MRNVLVIIVLVCVSISTSAQITNIYPSKDSSIVINGIYAGSLNGTKFSTDSLYSSGFTGLRFGAMATYHANKWISVSSLGMVQIDAGSTPWSLQQFWMNVDPTQKLNLQIGSTGTLPTEQRPLPVTGPGQFETWTQSQIPGMALNAKVRYQFTKEFALAGGIAVRKNMPEYSGKVTYKKVQLSGWYGEHDKKLGTALTVNVKNVSSTFVFKQDQTIADFLFIKLPKDWALYSDMGYDLNKKDLVRGEWGVLKFFDSKWTHGLFGLGYNHNSHSINGYLFVHL